MAVSDSAADAAWFAVNRRPRHETTVAGRLELCGVEGFLLLYPCKRPFKREVCVERSEKKSPGMSLTCPKCGSSRIHRSHRRTLAERLGLLLAAKMKRCHECNFRFVQLYGATLLLSDLQRSVRKLAWTGVIVMALLAVLAIVVWFSNKQAAYTPSP
jgi:hypothetical protein